MVEFRTLEFGHNWSINKDIFWIKKKMEYFRF